MFAIRRAIFYGRSLTVGQCNTRFFSSTAPNNGIRILYASQTGTAQLFATQLEEGLEDEEGIEDDITIQALDEEPPNEILVEGDIHLVLASCTGKGEPPDNGRKFYDWISNDPSATIPPNIKFAVFGLGNESAHPNHYNVIGQHLDTRLHDMGGQRMKKIGLGDDGGCIEGGFDEWMGSIIDTIKEDADGLGLTSEIPSEVKEDETITDVKEDTSPIRRLVPSKKYSTIILNPAEGNIIRRDLFHLQGSSNNTFYSEKTCKLKVIGSELLTPDAGESALHEIRISSKQDYANNDENNSKEQLTYTTGDHVLLYPRNSETIVNAYVDLLGVDNPHAIISNDNAESYPYPTGITIAETLSHCIDLGALPSPSFSRMILGRKDLDYINEIANRSRTVIDLCHEAGIRISLEDLLHNATPMQPRYYSIASSNIKHPAEIHLVFRPVHYMTTKGYLREGVCTSFMTYKGSSTKRGTACIPGVISSNPTFRLPEDTAIPIMLVAGGCGVAPIRAFLEERIDLQSKGHDLGPATLLLGFRNPEDAVYQDLIQKALDVGALTTSEVVYSSGCDPLQYCQQMLVSDLVRQLRDHVWDHLQAGGHIYMCGGARTFGAAIETYFRKRVTWTLMEE